jgi:hypothetical protein
MNELLDHYYAILQLRFFCVEYCQCIKRAGEIHTHEDFTSKYGDGLYLNLKRISQDHVESYFSA